MVLQPAQWTSDLDLACPTPFPTHLQLLDLFLQLGPEELLIFYPKVQLTQL
jgi:hypothetical protein